MIKFLFKNRTALQIFLAASFLLVGYNVTNSIADNVEVKTIDASQNIDDLKIINVNINVDFDKPLDYVEPEPQEEKVPEPVVNNYMEEPEYDTIRFPGRGHRLGTA